MTNRQEVLYQPRFLILQACEQHPERQPQLKQNSIDNIDNIAYQKLLRPLAKERERLTTEQFFYERKEINRLLEHGDITCDMIYRYIQRKR